MKRKHTLVVGGTRGTGRVVVKTLAQEDHIVSVIGRKTFIESDRHIPNVEYWLLDLLDKDGRTKALTEMVNKNGKLNNLIFFQRYRDDGDDWSGEIETSLTATKQIIDCVVDEFDDTSEKCIVIVSSIASHFIAAEQPISYHVAKAGIKHMACYYAVLLASKGIRVNCVSPGTVLKEESKNFYLKNRQLRDLYKQIIPLGRMCTSKEIANVVIFLCSEKSSFITGQDIVIDGGLSLIWQETLARKLASINDRDIRR